MNTIKKGPSYYAGTLSFFKLERETGFEPATSTLARSHSTTELFPLSELSYITNPISEVNTFLRISYTSATTRPSFSEMVLSV